MSTQDLPPLHFLPAFEAAGRLGSFRAAASELHVTPSAISQQLKALEQALGMALFERRGRAIVLSAAGAHYLRDIQQSLAAIALAGKRLRRAPKKSVLRLTTADYIAYEFLLPRLSKFRERFPGLELSLEATTRIVDFATSDIDAAIRIADGPFAGLVSTRLGDASFTPVCAPALSRKIRKPEQLRGEALIELRGQESRGWASFLKAKREPGSLKRLYFDSYLETMRAAEQGLGVALAVFPMTTEWVLNGRLAVPLAIRVPLTAKISLLYRESDAESPLYPELGAWLCEQYKSLPALPPGRITRARRRRATALPRR